MRDVSVVVPTHNQAGRLRLVLAALAGQTLPADQFETIVVDDASTDGTGGVLAAAYRANLKAVRQWPWAGRNRCRNLGVAVATGRLVVFLDGDALPAPDLVETFWRAWCQGPTDTVLCGFLRSLADVEYLDDPTTGSPLSGDLPSVVHDYLLERAPLLRVTPVDAGAGYAAIRARAQDGGYPFPESAARQRQALELLRQRPDSPVAWLAFVPHNGAVPRHLLRCAGGFDEQMPFSEGWELAYRLQHRWGAVVRAAAAESCHLYHRHTFAEDPLAEARSRYLAIERLAGLHLDPRVRLVYFWYAALAADPLVPEDALVHDLLQLDQRYRQLREPTWRDCERVLRHHPVLSAWVGALAPASCAPRPRGRCPAMSTITVRPERALAIADRQEVHR